MKTGRYERLVTDLMVNLGGESFELTRRYDSLESDLIGSFGPGWTQLGRDADLVEDLRAAAGITLGGPAPLGGGERIYVTLPNGRRVAFTFTPQALEVDGKVAYFPAWTGASGETWTLQTPDIALDRAGGRFFELDSARPYRPDRFVLTAPDGFVFKVEPMSGVVERIAPGGGRLILTTDAIVEPVSGEAIVLLRDASKRVTTAIALDGTRVIYTYDEAGRLVAARNLATGAAARYGYADGRVATVLDADGGGETIRFTPAGGGRTDRHGPRRRSGLRRRPYGRRARAGRDGPVCVRFAVERSDRTRGRSRAAGRAGGLGRL